MSNFEKKVLYKLASIRSDIKEIKLNISRLETKVNNIETTVSGIQEKTMILRMTEELSQEDLTPSKIIEI
ncbi:MAG TPA: hypothetical protein VK426_03935 [Methanobacterium sp.]|nr:hypothetical protein [Methanobacterium sp.]